ncbi:hypothetical protein JCM39068_44000 [Desulfocastanea catecholica]
MNVDTTWTLANSPFNLTSELQIRDGVTLAIEPGVEINGNSYIVVNAGNVLAHGTKDFIIIFNNTVFENADDREYALLSFDYCYMNNGSYFNYGSTDGSLIIKHSTLEGPKNLIIWLMGPFFGTNEKVELTGNKLINIGMLKLSVSPKENVSILNNLFTGNSYIESWGGFADIRNNSFLNKQLAVIRIAPTFGDDLEVGGNFWNTTSSNVIESMIFDANDDLNITGYVSYDPWLMAPHPDTPGVDSDGDGIYDHNDGCPSDPSKIQPGICGCGSLDIDADRDQMMDCWEELYGLNVLIDDSKEDLDKDGYSNIVEYRDNTIPNDPSSYKTKSMPWLFLLLGGTAHEPKVQ